MTEHTLKHICAGILAHVDAGKTTLSEGLLYLCGEIRKLGRVDHGDAFLDTYELEKERGITIFFQTGGSAYCRYGDHPSGYAGTCGFFRGNGTYAAGAGLRGSGDQRYGRSAEPYHDTVETAGTVSDPVFLFINKMDQEGTDRDGILSDLKKRLDENCIDFSADTDREEWMENVSLCDETLMESYLESGEIDQDAVAELIRSGNCSPVISVPL